MDNISGDHIYLRGQLGEFHDRLVIDTGAQDNAISVRSIEDLQLTRQVDRRYQGTVAGVGASRILGMLVSFPLVITDDQRSMEAVVNLHVIESDSPMIILGIGFLEQFDAILHIRKRTITFTPDGGPVVEFRFLNQLEMQKYEQPIRIAPLAELTKQRLIQILGNIASNPNDLKYRSLKLSILAQTPGCVEHLTQLGFEPDLTHERLVFAQSNLEPLERCYLRLMA